MFASALRHSARTLSRCSWWRQSHCCISTLKRSRWMKWTADANGSRPLIEDLNVRTQRITHTKNNTICFTNIMRLCWMQKATLSVTHEALFGSHCGCVCGAVGACVAESELRVCDDKRWSRSLHLMTHSLDVRHWIWCFKHYANLWGLTTTVSKLLLHTCLHEEPYECIYRPEPPPSNPLYSFQVTPVSPPLRTHRHPDTDLKQYIHFKMGQLGC